MIGLKLISRQYRLHLALEYHLHYSSTGLFQNDAPKNSVKDPVAFRSGFACVVPDPLAQVSI